MVQQISLELFNPHPIYQILIPSLLIPHIHKSPTCDIIIMKYLYVLLFSLLLLSTQSSEGDHYEFETEIGRLLDILINSIYPQKDIFLRELISNAADALDKIRFEAIESPSVLGTETELEIRVEFNEKEKSLSIRDNGVGMTKNDLIQNLGTIAKSGTTKFLEAIKGGNLNLIGQFGVGFYSTFIVASKVQVVSKHNSDSQWKWESEATNSFTIQPDDSLNLKRGTFIKLFLKEDAYEFCNYDSLQGLIKRYSSFINFPIYLRNIVEVEHKEEKTQAEMDKEKDELVEKARADGKEDIDEEEIENTINRTKVIKKPTEKWERMNPNKPLWLRDKRDVEVKEYKEFFKAAFKDTSEPSTWIHFKAEGEVEFSSLMYVPERAAYDNMDKFYEKKATVKLYVRRVLINDEFEDLLPKYLNFIKSIVDSDELELNVNRQELHNSQALKVIGNKLHKKAVEMLQGFNPELEEEDEEIFEDSSDEQDDADFMKEGSPYDRKVEKFNKFWRNYGKNIKLGLIEDSQNKDKLAPLTRWYTTHNVTKLTSLDQYLARMKAGTDGQKKIYFLGGEDRNTLQHSPLIEKLVNEGYEIILGDDPIDETVFNHFKSYKDIKIVNVARNDFKDPTRNDDVRKTTKSLTKTFQPLIDYAGQELKGMIKDVKVSSRLVASPVVIIADMMNDTPNRERLELASTMKSSLGYHKERNILEINPYHPLIQELNSRVEEGADEYTENLIKTLYYAALIHTGFVMRDPLDFSKDTFKLINTALGVKENEEIREIEVTEEQLEEMEPKPREPEPTNSAPESPEGTPAEPEVPKGSDNEVIDLQNEEL